MPAVTSAAPITPDTIVASRVLGEITVTPEQRFRFPEGLRGFEDRREWVLLPAAREGLWWLQSIEEEALAFLLVDPFEVAPGYELDLSANDEQFLGLESPTEALVLTVVTLAADREEASTTNLRGPLIFNTARRLARQVVSAVDRYDFHHPFDPRSRPVRS